MDPDQRVHLHKILRDCLPALDADDELDLDRPLGQLGLTSLGTIDLVLQIEDEFGVLFPDELLVADTFSSGAKLTSVVAGLVGQGR